MKQYDLKPVKDATKELDESTYEYVTCAYFNGKKELRSLYTEKMSRLEREDALKYFDIIKESLKGTVNKNIFRAGFSDEAKRDGEIRSILKSTVYDGRSDAIVLKLCEKIMDAVEFENGVNYLITVAWNTIDIKPKTTDRQTIDDASEFSYSYAVISVCPAKLSDSGLTYDNEMKVFRSKITDWVVEKPKYALLYPVPNGDGADINNVVFFSKTSKPEPGEEFIKKLTGKEAPVSVEKGFTSLKTIINETVDIEGHPEVLDNIDIRLAGYKEGHMDADNAIVTKETLKDIIKTAAGSEKLPERFEEKFEEAAEEVRIPVYSIKPVAEELKKNAVLVKAENPDVIKKKVIDGVEYILIPVSEGVSIEKKKS